MDTNSRPELSGLWFNGRVSCSFVLSMYFLAQTIISKVCCWLGGDFQLHNFLQWLNWLRNTNSSRFVNDVYVTAIQVVLYMIWTNRNSYIFSNLCHFIDWCFGQIQLVVRGRSSLHSERVKTDTEMEFYSIILVQFLQFFLLCLSIGCNSVLMNNIFFHISIEKSKSYQAIFIS